LRRSASQRHAFSSSTGTNGGHENDNSNKYSTTLGKGLDTAVITEFVNKNHTAIIGAGAVTGALGVTQLMYMVGNYMLNLSSTTALFYGFSGGVLVTASATFGAYIVERSFRIEPEEAVKAAMSEIMKNKDMVELLGSNSSLGARPIEASNVRSYYVTSGGVGILGLRPTLFHPRVRVMFQITGSRCNALVYATYTKKGFRTEYAEYVGVDWPSPTGGKLSLTIVGSQVGDGSESEISIKEEMKAHIHNISAELEHGRH